MNTSVLVKPGDDASEISSCNDTSVKLHYSVSSMIIIVRNIDGTYPTSLLYPRLGSIVIFTREYQ